MRGITLVGFALVLVLSILVSGVQASTQLVIMVKDATDETLVDDAEVYINSQYVGKTGMDGGFTYVHPADSDLDFIIKKQGYRSWSGTVGQYSTSLNVFMERSQKTLYISVYDVETIVPVHKAEVSITNDDNTAVQKTDSGGKVEFEVQTDTSYDLEIRATGYQTYTSAIEMGAEDKKVQKYLTRSGKFVFSVTDALTGLPLEGAEVRLDKIQEGFTDDGGQLPLYISREHEYLIEVIKQDYIPYSEEVYLSEDDALLFVPLSMSHYQLTVSVRDAGGMAISGADVDIGGDSAGITDAMGVCGVNDIVAGTYRIEVAARGFDDWSEDVIVSGGSETVYVKMNFSQVPLNLKVTEPSGKPVIGVLVLLDGTSIGFTDVNGNLETSVGSGVSYVISLSKDGYISKSIGMSIPAGTDEMTETIAIEPEFPAFFVALSVIIGIVIVVGGLIYIRKEGMSSRRSRPDRKGGLGKRPGGRDL